MNMTFAMIMFAVLYVLDIVAYIVLYHKFKKKTLAITIAGIVAVFISTGFIFLIPFEHKATITEATTSSIHTEKDEKNSFLYDVICDDGTEYEVKAINTMASTGYESYRNDSKYANEKVEVTFRYDHKIWWIIPVHAYKYETWIYFDNDWFNKSYGCNLDYNVWTK